jgi:hypothetical protein
LLRIVGAFGAVLGYGCLAAFLYLITLQLYRWFREGDWTRFGVVDGMQVWLTRCCVKDGDTGRLRWPCSHSAFSATVYSSTAATGATRAAGRISRPLRNEMR